MTKTKSGLILLGVGILINLIGRLIAIPLADSNNAGIAGFLLILMFASVVVAIFGLFRLITGLITRS